MKNGRSLMIPDGRGVPPWVKKRIRASSGVVCPVCGGGTIVIDSRPRNGGMQRRRACDSRACGHRFTTREVIGLAADIGDDAVGEAAALLRDTAALLGDMADRLEARRRHDRGEEEDAG